MESSPAKEKTALKSEIEKNSTDPFASDIFAAARAEETDEPEIAPPVVIEKPAWVWRLPKIVRPLVDWNALRKNLPGDFYEDLPGKLAGSLANILNFEAENPIEFLFLTGRETNEIGETGGDSWWLNFGFETSEAVFAVEINEIFAVWLVDALIGGEKSESVRLRELTASEIAALEFIAANLTYEANRIISAPLLKFRGLSRKSPALFSRIQNDDAENSLLVANWQTVHGFLNSIVKIYAATETFKALDPNENELLNAAPRRRKNWATVQTRVSDARSRLYLGAAQMTLADVAGLETGDVVLPENYNFSIADGDLRGAAEIRLGDGENIKIKGIFAPSESESPVETLEANEADKAESLVRRVPSNQPLRVVVELFDETENPRFDEKSMSNEQTESNGLGGENAFEDLSEGGGIALENLAVTLRVELEARRLSLEEVGNLRVNQIIELGASAADPVNLLIDGKIVARGELVEVENRLGVRIIQILR